MDLWLTPDFGIINANGERTNEFIEFIQQNQHLSKSVRYTYVELVIASMNEAILNKTANIELFNKFDSYIKTKIDDKSWYPQVDYWIEIRSIDEYLIGDLLIKMSNRLDN